MPYQAKSRVSRLAGGSIGGTLNVGHGVVNVVMRLLVALFCFGLVLQTLNNASDPYRCGALVRHGSWPPYRPPKVDVAADYELLETLQRQGRGPPPARSFEKWEPAGCRMHEYSRDDIRECLAGKRVLFVGDSTMRVLFFAALTRLDHEAAEWLLRTTFIERNPRHDLSIESETVQLQFIWDPWLNSTLFEEELRRFEPGGDNKNVDSADKPDLVIIGSAGLWAARNTADDLYFDTFRAATDHVSRVMVNTVQPFGKHTTDNYVFLAPVQIPRYELLLPDRAQALSPERITRMNGYLASLPTAVKSHILTAYNEMTYQVPEAYEDTGLHVSDAVAERWIDVPLNALSYLFLSAFGHTSYFLWFRDFSLRRVALVLLRLNLLPSLLALMLDGKDMGTPNSIFVSAAVVCVVLCLRKFGVFEILDRITQLLLGRPTMWDIPKMHQAVLTAWCGPFAGMVVAVLAQRVAILCDRMQRHQQQKQQLLSGQEPPLPGHAETNTTKTKTSTDSNAAMPSGARANAGIMTGTGIFSHYTSLKDTSARNSISKDACFLDRLLVAILYPNEFMAPVQAMVIIFSSVFLFGYASATTVSPALDGKKASPCLTTAAVVCFAIVRNAHARLRAIYMALPAALGAIALELSVLHNHVLLSGNGTGHLRLSPFYSPVVEHSGGSLGEYIAAAKAAVMHSLGIASITAVFLIVSWHTHQSWVEDIVQFKQDCALFTSNGGLSLFVDLQSAVLQEAAAIAALEVSGLSLGSSASLNSAAVGTAATGPHISAPVATVVPGASECVGVQIVPVPAAA
ncbi:MAG: hypothetical protein STHCBS139747_006255 [Sporothrix thermara]